MWSWNNLYTYNLPCFFHGKKITTIKNSENTYEKGNLVWDPRNRTQQQDVLYHETLTPKQQKANHSVWSVPHLGLRVLNTSWTQHDLKVQQTVTRETANSKYQLFLDWDWYSFCFITNSVVTQKYHMTQSRPRRLFFPINWCITWPRNNNEMRLCWQGKHCYKIHCSVERVLCPWTRDNRGARRHC